MSDPSDSQQIDATIRYYEGTVAAIYRAIFGAVLHLAIFDHPGERLERATARTKAFLADRLPLTADSHVVDLGSGYGDAARYLAGRFGCRITGVNLIYSQNAHAAEQNAAAGLGHLIDHLQADFARVPLVAGAAGAVWSQESFLHAPDRARVIHEAARVLAPGGYFVFTDILQTGPMDAEEATALFERVKINSLGTFARYRALLQQAGLTLVESVDLSQHVAPYYAQHAAAVERARPRLAAAMDDAYVDYTVAALNRWVTAAKAGRIGWGMFLARKPT